MFFPTCDFKLMLPARRLLPGTTNDIALVLEAPEAVPRAEVLLVEYEVTAFAGYGSGKNRTEITQHPFRDRWTIPLEGGLPAGESRFNLKLALPIDVPPTYKGDDCAISHALSARLDVPWASDPKGRFNVEVAQRPRKGPVTPLFSRTSPTFHESLLFELTLVSSVLAADQPIQGKIALRGGHDATFDALLISTVEQASIGMGRNDQRTTPTRQLRVHAEELRPGDPISFEFPPGSLQARFKSGYIDVETLLSLTIEIPWRSDPVCHIPIKIMPAGSRTYGEGEAPAIGSARTRRFGSALAEHTGLEAGTGAELVKGAVGPIGVALVDVTRGAKPGIDARFAFPSLELGTSFGPIGAFDLFRGDGFAPSFLAATHWLRSAPGNDVPRYDAVTLQNFYDRVLGPLDGWTNFRLSDRALACHLTLDPRDDVGSALRAADHAMEAARKIAAAIDALPFPEACRAHEATWRAFAKTTASVVLVPSGPALHGVVLGRRISNGDQRVLRATLGTAWSKKGPITRVEVTFDAHFRGDEERLGDFLEEASARVSAVRATFPTVELDPTGAVLEATSFIGDPRDAVEGLERFLEWFIDARGERVADAPYR